jgi:hypothetical protein
MMDAIEIAVRHLGQLRHREQDQWKKYLTLLAIVRLCDGGAVRECLVSLSRNCRLFHVTLRRLATPERPRAKGQAQVEDRGVQGQRGRGGCAVVSSQ